ncbi:hypothetical protein ACJMK2_044639 [Sinanodonta woodiana]|uniref:Uncharacterized protein n=1 Tax=Sinanodonta woodiana TaxID=1069815 RepID=A0ABD3W0N5_SINWO
MPQGGYTSAYLVDKSNLGQAVCYIRPIQRDLDLSALTDCQEPWENAQKEEWLTCGQMIVLGLLREHVSPCKKGYTLGSCQESLFFYEFRMTLRSVHHHARGDHRLQFANIHVPSQCKSQSKEMGTCPLCQLVFEVNELEHHAAICGDIT